MRKKVLVFFSLDVDLAGVVKRLGIKNSFLALSETRIKRFNIDSFFG